MSKLFPIMGGPAIPWEVIEPHGKQALKNHDQTLERLAERGGLCPAEALATLYDHSLFPYFAKLKTDGVTDAQAATMLEDYVKERWYLPRIASLESTLKERDAKIAFLRKMKNGIYDGLQLTQAAAQYGRSRNIRGACNCAAMEFVNAKLKELEAALDERHKQVMAQIQENLEAKKSQ